MIYYDKKIKNQPAWKSKQPPPPCWAPHSLLSPCTQLLTVALAWFEIEEIERFNLRLKKLNNSSIESAFKEPQTTPEHPQITPDHQRLF